MALFNTIEIGEAIATFLSLFREGRILALLNTIRGRGPETTIHTSGKTDDAVKADTAGKGIEDEYLFFAALGHYLEENGARVIDGKVTLEHIKTFNQICQTLKASGRKGAVKMLRRVVGVKETTITTKKNVGIRRRKNQGKEEEEPIFEDEKDELNIKGARILLTLHAIGVDQVIEIIESTGVLDNLEDNVTLGIKASKKEFGELLKKHSRTIEETAAWFCLSPQGYEKAMRHPPIRNLLDRIDQTQDVAVRKQLTAEYLELLQNYVKAQISNEQPTATAGIGHAVQNDSLATRRWQDDPKIRTTLILLALLALGIGSCSITAAIQ